MKFWLLFNWYYWLIRPANKIFYVEGFITFYDEIYLYWIIVSEPTSAALLPSPVPSNSSRAKTPMLDEWVMPYIDVTSDDRHQCRLCPHREDGLPALKRHIFAVHLNYKPYKCKYCTFTAVEPNTTELHLLKIHPNQPPRIVRLRYKGMPNTCYQNCNMLTCFKKTIADYCLQFNQYCRKFKYFKYLY